MIKDNVQELTRRLELGDLIPEPKRVLGGLLHKMYRVDTNKGRFAIKELNPSIIKRGEEVMNNFVVSEKVAQLAKENGIPAVPAIGDKELVYNIKHEHYMIFQWVDAKCVVPETVNKEHCTRIGEILAKLHAIDFSDFPAENRVPEIIEIEWKKYTQEKSEISNTLEEALDKLHTWDCISKKSTSMVCKNQRISHRDMDCKNVLWDQDRNPVIIDWEASGYINPLQELLDVALSWGGIESDTFNLENFQTLVESYIQQGGVIEDDIVAVLNYGYHGKLEWLEYNIKRSLGLETSSEEEKQIGIGEVEKTIGVLKRYEELVPILEGVLKEFK
jgi:thiamine kinase-like enzyme